MNQPYKCETDAVFQARLETLKEYIRESNLDGILDYYCPTSPVLHHLESNIVYIVDTNLSYNKEHMKQIVDEILQTIISENGGVYPVIEYIYA